MIRQGSVNSGTGRAPAERKFDPHWPGMVKGLILTATLAAIAGQIAALPLFSVMGVMIVSIMVGVLWKTIMDAPAEASAGITFSSKYLLRAGIVLMGLRLNIGSIAEAGFSVILTDAAVIAFTLAFMLALGHLLRVERRMSALITVGTAVCGAAAIAAVAPLIGAKKETTALSVACISVLGTAGALVYIFLYPHLGLDPYAYGVLVGATLHELAHVIAAGVPGGETGSDAAILVKLGRVALLIPVALALGWYFQRSAAVEAAESSGAREAQGARAGAKEGRRALPVPWFIFGFLAMSVVNSLDVLPETLVRALMDFSVFLLSTAMVSLGLSIRLGDFKKIDRRTVFAAVSGFAALSALGAFLAANFH